MKFATDIEGLRNSCHQMRLSIEELRHLDRSLASNAQQLNTAPQYNNISEAYSITRDLANRTDKLQYYIELMEYWSSLLEIALKARYIPETLLVQFDKIQDQAQSIMHGTAIATTATFNEAQAALVAAGQFVINLSAESCKVATEGATRHTSLLDNAATWLSNRINEAENLIAGLISKLIDSFRQAIGEAASILNTTGSFLKNVGSRVQESFSVATLETSVDFLDGSLKVAEWLSDATWIKNTGVWVGRVAKILTLVDLGRYFTGNMTNREIVETLTQSFIPIPIINEWAGEYLGQYVPDPDGHFQLVAPAGGDLADGVGIEPGDWAKPHHTDPVPLDKFLTSKLQESYKVAKDFYNNAVEFGKSTVNFISDKYNETQKVLGQIFETARESFVTSVNFASKALTEGMVFLDKFIQDTYHSQVNKIGAETQVRLNSLNQDPDTVMTNKLTVKGDVYFMYEGVPIVVGAGTVIETSRELDPKSGKFVDTVILKANLSAGPGINTGKIIASAREKDEFSITLKFEEGNNENMAQLEVLMETLGVWPGSINTGTSLISLLPGGASLKPALAGGELALFKDKITDITNQKGLSGDASADLKVVSGGVSLQLLTGDGIKKYEDGKFYPTENASFELTSQGGVGLVKAEGVVTFDSTIGKENGKPRFGEVTLKVKISEGGELAKELEKTLLSKGIGQEVAEKVAEKVADGLEEKGSISVTADAYSEYEVKFTADDLRGKAGNTAEAILKTLTEGEIDQITKANGAEFGVDINALVATGSASFETGQKEILYSKTSNPKNYLCTPACTP